MRPGLGLGGMTHSLVVILSGWDAEMGDGDRADDMVAELAMPIVLIGAGRVLGRMAILGALDDVVDDGVEASDSGDDAAAGLMAAPGDVAVTMLFKAATLPCERKLPFRATGEAVAIPGGS